MESMLQAKSISPLKLTCVAWGGTVGAKNTKRELWRWTMNSVARIDFRGGSLVMPARSRYDRELVFEQAEFYARRDGATKLELDRRHMLVSVVHNGGTRACSRCGEQERQLAFVDGATMLCRRCARHAPH
jgi:hypothetical protein